MKYVLALALFALVGCGTPPSTSTAQTSAPSVAGGFSAQQLNAIRSRAAVPAIGRNAQLDAAALEQAQFMAASNTMTHRGRNGSNVGARVGAQGYRWCVVAENVFRGHADPAFAIEAWRTSPGHFRNMTNGKVREFGMASVGEFHAMVLAAQSC